jgi:hypothetical protein
MTILNVHFPVLTDVWTNVLSEFLLPNKHVIQTERRILLHTDIMSCQRPRRLRKVMEWHYGHDNDHSGLYFQMILRVPIPNHSMCWVNIWYFDWNGQSRDGMRHYFLVDILTETEWNRKVRKRYGCMRCSSRKSMKANMYDHKGNTRIVILCPHCRESTNLFGLFNESDGQLWLRPTYVPASSKVISEFKLKVNP